MKRLFVSAIILLAASVVPASVRAEEILRWEGCLAEAQKNNPQLISALEAIKVKEGAVAAAKSGALPQLDASAEAARAKSTTTADSYSAGVSATQLVFDGARTSTEVRSARQTAEAARQNWRFSSSDVRLTLRTAFIDLLKAQELITVAEEIAKIRRDSLELVTLRYQSGLEHRGALLTAEANAESAAFDLVQARRSVETAERELSAAMGRKTFSPFKVEGDFIVRENSREKPDLDALAKKHPLTLQSLANKNAAGFDVRSTRSQYYPELSARAGASKNGSDWPPESDRWNAGLTMNMPILEGGLRSAQLAQAQALYRQAEADERSTRDSVAVALQNTWTGLQDALDTVRINEKKLSAAVERSMIAEAQYSTGFITFDNWIIIENDLVSAKRSYLEARASALRAEAGWVQAKGETLEYAQ